MTSPAPPARTPYELAVDALAALREARRGNAPKTGGGVFTTVYTVILGVATFTAMVLSGTVGLVNPVSCTTLACTHPDQRLTMAVALTGAALAAIGLAAQWAGPLGADPARVTWLHSTPALRSRLLRGRLIGALVALGTVGGIAGSFGAVLAFGSDLATNPLRTLVVAVDVALIAASITAWAASAQSRSHLLLQRLFVGVLVVGLLVAVVPAPLSPYVVAGLVALARVELLLTVLLASTLVAWLVSPGLRRRIAAIPRAELVRGGEGVGALEASALMMDPSVAADLVATRRARRRGRFASARSGGVGVAALVRRSVRTLWRSPDRLVILLATLSAPVVLGRVAGAAVALVAAAVVIVSAARSLGSTYLAWSRSSALRRLYPSSDAKIRLSLLVAPMTLVVGWAVAATLLGSIALVAVGGLVAAALAGLLDAGRPPALIDYSTVVSTPAGALPVGMVAGLTRGLMASALCVAPFLVTTQPVALVIPLLVVTWSWYRASTD